MKCKLLVCLIFFILFSANVYGENNISSQTNHSYKKTLLVKLKPELKDNQVVNTAKEYKCSTGKIYRFSYDDNPHITVKFFIVDKDLTPLDVLFNMEGDERIISAMPDMKGRVNSEDDKEPGDDKAVPSADEITEKVLDANRELLEAMGWFKADEYYNTYKREGETKTLIVQLDSGVDYENYPWLKENIVHIEFDDEGYGHFSNDLDDSIMWDYSVLEGDSGALDDRDEEFKKKHGSVGAGILTALSPETRIVPIQTSNDDAVKLSNFKLGLERTLSSIDDLEDLTEEDYSIVVNITTGFSEVNAFMELIDGWLFNDNAESLLFPRFKNDIEKEGKWNRQVVEAGYNPDNVTYEDILKSAEGDERLQDIAISWLFEAIYVKGNLSPKLKPIDLSEGPWSEISAMKDRGWMILSASSNYTSGNELDYPAMIEGVEAVDGFSVGDNGNIISGEGNLHGDWVEVAGPVDLTMYDSKKDSYEDIRGTSWSTYFLSAVYARLWNIAPDLTKEELNRIVKGTAFDVAAEGGYKDKKFIHPYRAIRVARVFQGIREYVSEYEEKYAENGDVTRDDYEELKENIIDLLEDTPGNDSLYAAVSNVEDVIISESASFLDTRNEVASVSETEVEVQSSIQKESLISKILSGALNLVLAISPLGLTGCTPFPPSELEQPPDDIEPTPTQVIEEPGETESPLPPIPTPDDIRSDSDILDILIRAVKQVVPADDLVARTLMPEKDSHVSLTNKSSMLFEKKEDKYQMVFSPVISGNIKSKSFLF